MNGEMGEGFLLEHFTILLEKIRFSWTVFPEWKNLFDRWLISLKVFSISPHQWRNRWKISLRLFNFFLSEQKYIHFSSELSSSKNFSFTLLGLTISAQRGTISLLSREMVQPSTGGVFFKQSFIDDVWDECRWGYSELQQRTLLVRRDTILFEKLCCKHTFL